MGEEAFGLEITELRLGPPGSSTEHGGKKETKRKRAFSVALEDENSTTEEGGGGGEGEEEEEEEPTVNGGRVVGWPPVCSYRQRSAAASAGGVAASKKKKQVYVKVSMDGAPFLRMVDLDARRGYADLTVAVEKLFGIRCSAQNDPEKGSEYAQIYEDKEGDWMLVGDVPWDMFTELCKRLRIMKSSEAKGFGLQLRSSSTEYCQK